MGNILKGVQQALEAIRIEPEKADWQLRLEIWAVLMLNQSAFCKKKLNKDSMMPSFMLVCTLYVCAQDFVA